ncbi:MAG TPA: rhodanese-like domain-containing protein, partial [Gemmatimonadaceae bacterium]
VVLYPVLTQIGVRGRDRKLIALFGPRGLSTLLLTLLPVFAGVAGAERLFTIACLVVLLSLVVHGSVIGFYLRRSGTRTPPAADPRRATGSHDRAPIPEPKAQSDRVTIDEVRALQQNSEPIVFVDSRAPKSYNADDRQIAGSVRIPPDDPVRAATEEGLAQHATLVVYCA